MKAHVHGGKMSFQLALAVVIDVDDLEFVTTYILVVKS